MYSSLPGRELEVSDVTTLDIERRMTIDPRSPTFYFYYATYHGDVLGKVLITDMEIIFDPLNEKFKGVYGYEYGDILENIKMGFIVSFKDVVGDPVRLLLVNSEEQDDTEIDIQIGLRHTGN